MEQSRLFSTEEMGKALSDLFYGERNPPRKVKLWTNAWGMDMVDEKIETEATGRTRLWLGYKVPRILRKLKGTIRKSAYTGRYFKII